MMKKLLCLGIIICLLFSLSACTKRDDYKSDALRFKEEYESYNGKKNESGKIIRTISISENNPFIYKSADDIVSAIEKKETFIVYFGFATCPWCRSVIPNLISVARDLEIKTIYYVDVLEIRDILKVSENGDIITERKGSSGYMKLLGLFDSVLADYSLKNNNGESVSTGEKRIYAPNIISVVNGEVKELTEGISEMQTDGYMELTKEMNQESYQMIKCSIQCVADASNICLEKKMC